MLPENHVPIDYERGLLSRRLATCVRAALGQNQNLWRTRNRQLKINSTPTFSHMERLDKVEKGLRACSKRPSVAGAQFCGKQ